MSESWRSAGETIQVHNVTEKEIQSENIIKFFSFFF